MMVKLILILLSSPLFAGPATLTDSVWKSCNVGQRDCYQVKAEKVGQSFVPNIQFARKVEIMLRNDSKVQKVKSDRAFYYPKENKWVLLPNAGTTNAKEYSLDADKMQLTQSTH